MQLSGLLRKMLVSSDAGVASYQVITDQGEMPLNQAIGAQITIASSGKINCLHCQSTTKKSYSQGYCYRCFLKLPQCDSCIMSPEKCHLQLGTCRDAAWGEANCETDHIVYLSNTSGVKIGITRLNQVPTRWFDQGASAALPVFRVATRRLAGLIESQCKEFLADKTNWRAMLKGEAEAADLHAIAADVQARVSDYVDSLQMAFGINAVQPLLNADLWEIEYPVRNYPVKVSSLNLDKTPEISGVLEGIKGQYLILDTGVINLRKYTSYEVSVTISGVQK